MQIASKIGFYKGDFDFIGFTAIAANGRVWKSYDRGLSWAEITPAVSSTALSTYMTDIVSVTMSNYAEPGVMFALQRVTGTDTTAAVVRSSDGIYWQRAGYVELPSGPGTWTTNQIVESNDYVWSISRNFRASSSAVSISWNDGSATSATWTRLGNFSTIAPTADITFGAFPGYTNDINSSVVLSSSLNLSINVYTAGTGSVAFTINAFTPSTALYTTNPPLYDRQAGELVAFAANGRQYYSSYSSTGLGYFVSTDYGTQFGTVALGTYARQSFAPAVGNYYVAGRTATGNTFYTWQAGSPRGAYTQRSVGSSLASAPHAVSGTTVGQLIYRNGSYGTSTDEAFWTTDGCQTFITRNLPSNQRWLGVFWQP